MGCGLIVFPMTDRFISKHRLGQNKRKQAQQENDEMKMNVTEYEFVKAFDDMNRGNNFSRAGRFALYEYLTEMESINDEEIELDVIALCCDFTEWESLEEFRENYGEEYRTFEDVADRTIIIANYPDLTHGTGSDETRFITQDF